MVGGLALGEVLGHALELSMRKAHLHNKEIDVQRQHA